MKKRLIAAVFAAACIPQMSVSASEMPEMQTRWATVSDIVAMSRYIAEDPDAPIVEGIRYDANCDGVVNCDDVTAQLQYLELYPLYEAISADLERTWLETAELFQMEHEGEPITITLTVSSGEGYGTALNGEPWLNAYDYQDFYQSGDIVLQMECESECMELFIANSLVYGHKFS